MYKLQDESLYSFVNFSKQQLHQIDIDNTIANYEYTIFCVKPWMTSMGTNCVADRKSTRNHTVTNPNP